MLAVGLLLSVRISKGIASPLQRLAEEAEEIGKGNLDRRIDVEAGGTVGVLADSFNSMVASLNEHIDELRETTAAKQTLETEVAVAADLQRSMLPKRTPQRPELDLAAHTRPARVVGGDLYDFVERPGGCLGLAIADASGKGLSAALYLAQCRSVLRTLALGSASAETVVRRGNEIILSTCECEGRFLTFLYAMYDPGTHVFSFVNAGHMAPLVVREGRLLADLQDEGTLPMGIQPDIDTTEHTVQLEHGDLVVLYSDGITDTQREGGDLFGIERLVGVVESCWGCSSRETIRRIRKATVDFAAGAEQADDLTLVVLRITG
jgi:sigma-B regulation protein RsbU (phosphoserine phosphatase)